MLHFASILQEWLDLYGLNKVADPAVLALSRCRNLKVLLCHGCSGISASALSQVILSFLPCTVLVTWFNFHFTCVLTVLVGVWRIPAVSVLFSFKVVI